MRAAAQFDAVDITAIVGAHRQHAYLVAIFLAKQRHGAGGNGGIGGHQFGIDRAIAQHLRVHIGFDRRQFRGGDRLGVREIEAQIILADIAALLGDMGAKTATQGGVQQMGGAVGAAMRAALRRVDRQLDDITHGQRAAAQSDIMQVQLAQRLARVAHAGRLAVTPADGAGIARLAAAFGIEGRLVGDHHHAFAGAGCVHLGAILYQRQHLGLAGEAGVTGELGGAVCFGNIEPHGSILGLARAGPGGARQALLFGHGGIEAGPVHRDAARPQRILGEIIGEAIGIIEAEGDIAGQGAAGRQLRRRLVEQTKAAFQRLAEARFLQLQRLLDQRLRTAKLGIGLAHGRHQRRHELVHERFPRTEQMGMAHGAAHDAAQHIAAALIGRQHAIGHQEAGRAQMIGNHPVRGARLGRERLADLVLAGGNQRPERVGIIIVVHALQHGGDALQAHAGIDAGPRQIEPRFAVHLLILHEHQVPDLDEAVTVLVRAAGRSAGNMIAVIPEDFRAGATGAGIAHRPEIVVGGDADDLVIGQAGDLLPQIGRLVVGVIDGDAQAGRVQPPFAGQQIPGQGDGAFLEIIAEREIAQHFKEGMMPGGIADIVQIIVLAAGAHAFLAACRGAVGPGLQPGEDILERHHAGVGEHQRGIVLRHQRCRRDDAVTGLGKMREEALADVVRGDHGQAAYGSIWPA